MNKEKPTALKVYKDYLAIKAHFRSDDYDYFKFKGKTKASITAYEKRKDKNFFIKLAKHKDYFNLLLCNIAYDDLWVGDISFDERAKSNYKVFLRRNQSLTYNIKQELKLCKPKLKENFLIHDAHPHLTQLYIEGIVSLEFISIVAKVTGAGLYWDKYMRDDVLWEIYRNKILKYERFLSYNKDKIKQLLIEYDKTY